MGDCVKNHSWVKFKAGNAQIWRAVLDEAIPKLYATFMRQWRNPSLAEELVQQTIFNAVRGMAQYDAEKGSPGQWLFGIARNNIRLEIRKRQVRPGIDGDITSCLEAIDSEMLPDEVLEKRETAQLVRAAMAELPDKEQAVLEGKYIEGLSARQIAARIDSTEKAVHSLLYRARINLREQIEKLAPLIKEGQK